MPFMKESVLSLKKTQNQQHNTDYPNTDYPTFKLPAST